MLDKAVHAGKSAEGCWLFCTPFRIGLIDGSTQKEHLRLRGLRPARRQKRGAGRPSSRAPLAPFAHEVDEILNYGAAVRAVGEAVVVVGRGKERQRAKALEQMRLVLGEPDSRMPAGSVKDSRRSLRGSPHNRQLRQLSLMKLPILYDVCLG